MFETTNQYFSLDHGVFMQTNIHIFGGDHLVRSCHLFAPASTYSTSEQRGIKHINISPLKQYS